MLVHLHRVTLGFCFFIPPSLSPSSLLHLVIFLPYLPFLLVSSCLCPLWFSADLGDFESISKDMNYILDQKLLLDEVRMCPSPCIYLSACSVKVICLIGERTDPSVGKWMEIFVLLRMSHLVVCRYIYIMWLLYDHNPEIYILCGYCTIITRRYIYYVATVRS